MDTVLSVALLIAQIAVVVGAITLVVGLFWAWVLWLLKVGDKFARPRHLPTVTGEHELRTHSEQWVERRMKSAVLPRDEAA
ncbi:hypothetical protein HMPREF0063_11943 [Aeromicrobium marinum DSM 15272]|uniref:Uncharacterized protein n=1 Tax=Aeromicrobium marinum DSM 15272 TaxID=585531 RepID=E2SE07_9ACTN|nr:hypothetical protein [Aeromicrobium marinum]EFQ82734.1 hypothetical protein HMPREF0063_11943 [Aeromicrobium marinum DSM 15272]